MFICNDVALIVMQRINVTVSDEAKERLLTYQRTRAIRRQDDTVEEILMRLEV